MDEAALARLVKIASDLLRPGETQQQMCDRVGLKRSKWLGWTQGRKPNADGFWELARALEIDVVELMERLEGREPTPLPPTMGGSMDELSQWLTPERLKALAQYWDSKQVFDSSTILTAELMSRARQGQGDSPITGD